MADQITLSPEVKKIAAAIPLPEAQILALTRQILSIAKERNLNLAGNIVAGLDVNGPIVACDNSDLIPFTGSQNCIRHLMSQPGVKVTLMTGWDLTTMGFFREERLKLPIGIVGEYGMAYELDGKTRHLYPYDEAEANALVSGVFAAVAPENLKVAFQGNVSPGAGAIYIEGDKNGNLLNHALVKGRRPTIQQLFNAIIEGGSKARLEGNKIVFLNHPENMRGFYQALFRKHPLISVRVKVEEGETLSFVIDEVDKPGFTYADLKAWGERAKPYTGRDVLTYEDFGVDLMSPKVNATPGKYSKDAGLREFAKEAFGTPEFICAIIGDKKSDVPKNHAGALMFALKGSDAEPIVKDMPDLPSVFPQDVRDFALALAEAHRIAKEGNKAEVKVEKAKKVKAKKPAKKAKAKAKAKAKKAKAKKPAKKAKAKKAKKSKKK
jgi:hypothetical protein